ncbi:oxidoreductase [Lipomyces japonicus]|uniref:oxidoreductase n=1 Tax=Lipomyces japonicus TaxID=56871 RepID=UPI0034CFF3F5
MEFNVNGKVALLTGDSRGLGFYAARALLRNGASRVFVSSRKADACVKAANELNSSSTGVSGHGKAIPIAADFSNPDDIKRVIDHIDRVTNGRLDIVIANAGAIWSAPLHSHDPTAIDKVLALNVRGVFVAIQSAARLLELS